MTFSVVARCTRTGQVGVAAATAVQSVGKLACHAIPNVGAIASQALLNPYLAYDGLRLLEQGASAEEALQLVLDADPQAENRQVGVIDRQGRTAAWTGSETIAWSGHLSGQYFVTQGNRIAGPQVLEAIARVMHDTETLTLAERLFHALQAGDKAGGDKHGERSANILVFNAEEYPLCDIRIDDHNASMPELQRLFRLYQETILPNMQTIPRRSDIKQPVWKR